MTSTTSHHRTVAAALALMLAAGTPAFAHGTGASQQGHAGGGTMGPGMMMGPMMGQPGTMGPCPGIRQGGQADRDLSADDVRAWLERWLATQGNPRLAVGSVEEKDENTIVADIVTKEGGVLVDRFEIDRHTGAMRRVG